MGKHIPAYDNKNEPIIDVNDDTTPLIYFNQVFLEKGESYQYQLDGYETAVVLAGGTCSISVDDKVFTDIGRRKNVWDGNPAAVYAPLGASVTVTCTSENADVMIAGRRPWVWKNHH